MATKLFLIEANCKSEALHRMVFRAKHEIRSQSYVGQPFMGCHEEARDKPLPYEHFQSTKLI